MSFLLPLRRRTALLLIIFLCLSQPPILSLRAHMSHSRRSYLHSCRVFGLSTSPSPLFLFNTLALCHMPLAPTRTFFPYPCSVAPLSTSPCISLPVPALATLDLGVLVLSWSLPCLCISILLTPLPFASLLHITSLFHFCIPLYLLFLFPPASNTAYTASVPFVSAPYSTTTRHLYLFSHLLHTSLATDNASLVNHFPV